MRRADDPAHETPGSARPYPGLDSLSERLCGLRMPNEVWPAVFSPWP